MNVSRWSWKFVLATTLLTLAIPGSAAAQSGEQLYNAICANCHGPTGLGDGPAAAALSVQPASFGDCSFARREPDGDWIGVALHGGASRGFSAEMPAHAGALSEDQIAGVVEYIRTLCTDDRWPRGELNLPRTLHTEKAYPEDEWVWTTSAAVEGSGSILNEIVYEKRFGPLGQIEVKLPFGVHERGALGWDAGIGDVKIGWKQTVHHSLESGSIFSLGGEVKLPTGSESVGFGGGQTVLEPFLLYGQILPNDFFLQAQALGEFPTDPDAADIEAKMRFALGRTWVQNGYGRAWSPMIEVLTKAEFADTDTEYVVDIVPQFQVTLNKRQHIMLNAGLFIPVSEPGTRQTRFMVYILWDYFDGGFFDGW